MENGVPLIKKFKTEKNFYIYDTWTNEILNVHKDFWDYLPDADGGQISEQTQSQESNLVEVKSEVAKAKEMGYLSTDRPEVATYYGWPNWKEEIANQINHNLQQLSLNVTEVCNFRCTYCAYSGCYEGNRIHSTKQMPWPIAKKAIDYAIEHSDDRAKNNLPLAISFYGGEPLSNFKLIKRCVEYTKENFSHRDIRFNMTTNGSLINEEIANFLVDHDFSLVFSIDGPAELHDRYRKTIGGKPTHAMTMRGYDLVKKIASEKAKRVSIMINCVMPPPFNLFAIEEFSYSIDNKFKLSLPSGINTSFYNQFDMFDEMKKYSSQIQQFWKKYKTDIASGVIENRNLIGEALFEKDIVQLDKRKMNRMGSKTASLGQCVPGSRKLFVSSDGFLYPCEKVSEQYCIGQIEKGIEFTTVNTLLENWSKFLSNTCKNCWAIRLCIKCFANFELSSGFKNNSLKNFCRQSKKRVERSLINYCQLQESNPNCLDFTKEIMIM